MKPGLFLLVMDDPVDLYVVVVYPGFAVFVVAAVVAVRACLQAAAQDVAVQPFFVAAVVEPACYWVELQAVAAVFAFEVLRACLQAAARDVAVQPFFVAAVEPACYWVEWYAVAAVEPACYWAELYAVAAVFAFEVLRAWFAVVLMVEIVLSPYPVQVVFSDYLDYFDVAVVQVFLSLFH